jgi:outer membrane protein assembly factor BamB
MTFDTIWKLITKEAVSMMNMNMACKDVLLCQTINGLLAVNKTDGKILWQRSGKYSGIFSRVGDEVLYTATEDTMLAIRVSDGKNKWSYSEKGVVFGFPDFDGKTIFCPMFIKKILDLEPSETKGPILISLDLESGKLRWKYEANGSIWDCFCFDNSVFFAPTSSSRGVCLYSISVDSGKINGTSYLFGAGITGRIIRSENSLILACTPFKKGGYVFSVDPQGKINWRTDVAKTMAGNMAPAIFDHKAFFLGDFDGKSAKLLAVDITTGSNRFCFELAATPNSMPTFFKDRLYIGCTDGFYIFNYPKFD